MKRFACLLLAVGFFAVFAAGCSTMNTSRQLTIHFVPTGKGPLTSLKPQTILVQVVDQRPSEERVKVLAIVADVGGTDSWSADKPVPLIVQDAVAAELSKCGHRVVTDPGAKADAVMQIVLKRFRAFLSTTTFRVSVEAQVDAEISVVNGSKTIPPFDISGNYQWTSGPALGHDLRPSFGEKPLSEALAEFVHNLTFDSRLVEGLQ